MRWRPMLEDDIPAIVGLANAVHLDYPESAIVFEACLALYPAGCHVLESNDGRIAGYLLSHPGRLDSFPALDVPLRSLPISPDCYFLHDLALDPRERGQGLAAVAVGLVLKEALRAGLETIALIAVGGAHDFWARHGFLPFGDGMLNPDKGYGAEARALVRKTEQFSGKSVDP